MTCSGSGREEGYFINGRTAIEVILSAMLAAGRTEFATVLDLPCGGGRVTRHLRALFPESEVYVSDIVEEKQRWAVDFPAAFLRHLRAFTRRRRERSIDLGRLTPHAFQP